MRAEDECRQLLVQFPNSKFAPEAQQKLRDIQEVLADSEFRTATFYHTKGSFPAAANRFQGMADQFPLYSQADEALWQLADSYQHMGDRFENQQVAALHQDRQGLSAERARRCRPGQAERNEPARAGSRSRGLRPHEV